MKHIKLFEAATPKKVYSVDINEIVKKIESELPHLVAGEMMSYIQAEDLGIEATNKIIDKLKGGSDTGIEQDWNGADLDWSMDIQIQGKEYECWGSAREGTLMIKLKK